MPCIYVLKSLTTGKHYTGSSRENNPLKRLEQHNAGKTKSIKSGIPWMIVYEEKYPILRRAKEKSFSKQVRGESFSKKN
ncbi:MAG: GIY-YIG nuclease family protein [Patescibacteria group bacterium]